MKIQILAAAAVLIAAPACAAESCMQMIRLYSWHELDKHALILEDVGHKLFKVDYAGYCGNLKFVLGIAVKSQSNSNLACLQRGDMLLTRQSNMNFQCMVEKVEPYSAPAPNP